MKVFCVIWSLVIGFVCMLVIMNLPYKTLSPRWFCTAVGVMFVAAAFIGFIWPGKKND